jgi:hypothetical protein
MHKRSYPRSDDADAFIRDPEGGPIEVDGSVDEEMVEEFMRTVTSGQESAEDVRNQRFAEDNGGPFVISTAGQELAEGVDESNPEDAYREAQPSPMRGH